MTFNGASPLPRGNREPNVEPPLESWTVAWIRDSYGGARESIARMRSIDDASTLVDDWLRDEYPESSETFMVPGLPGAVGLRRVGFAWLWAQSDAVGPFIDEVEMQFGSTVIEVGLSNVSAGSDHHQVEALARQVAARANR